MATLSKKIDFAVIIKVKNANPNGDPLNGNRPRTDYEGFGEISDVCLKRKLRDRLLEKGEKIFVQSDDNKRDDYPNLRKRAEAVLGDVKNLPDIRNKACETWFDVRAFGQIFPFKGSNKKSKKKEAEDASGTGESASGVSIGIRGPVSIHPAFSLEDISSQIISEQIIKSTSLEGDGVNRQPDQMGMKHRIGKEVIYVTFGSMNPQLAERTGFSDEDTDVIKAVLPKLFENDASSARPEGSMAVKKVIWWEHKPGKVGQYSSAKVHKTLTVNSDGSYSFSNLAGLTPEEIDGF
ncbi:MAG: type I-C CRISPR-associated protein Cas7/Csd2 [Candidatus Babeliaceae bacterium]|nr:type I-C CRISPR-associated protein Cas7/Csd2 [Candidatus Babeliaceae bacterium]